MDTLFIFIFFTLVILSTKNEENVIVILCFVLVVYFYIQFKTERKKRLEGYIESTLMPYPQPTIPERNVRHVLTRPPRLMYDTRINNTDKLIDDRHNDRFLKQPYKGMSVPYNTFAPRDSLSEHDLYSYKNLYYNRMNLRQKQSNFNKYNSMLHKFDKHYPKSKLSWFYY